MSSHPLLHTLDDEAQVFTHLLFVQVLLFTALQEGRKEGRRDDTGEEKRERESLEPPHALIHRHA